MPNADEITVTLLGTGTSHGIPMIACDCAVCLSDDPRDKRTRPGIHIAYRNCSILVDTPPELRLQCIANDIRRVDAVLFTHHHADHVVGIDDLRRFNWITKGTIPCFASPETAVELRRMFRYGFETDESYPSSAPRLDLHELDASPVEICGQRVIPIPLFHGRMPVLGFRFGTFAYCTDCSLIPENSFALLEGLDVLVLDALRRTPHPTHFNLEQAIAAAKRIGAKQTFFTHIAHELKHAETNEELPDSMALGYDGQVISARA